MTEIRLHLISHEFDGKKHRKHRRTFLVRDDGAGGVDIVDVARPLCEADRSVVIGEDEVLEVERVG